MVAGTGLPIKERAPTLLEPPPRAQISTAGAEMLGQAVGALGQTVSRIGDDMQKMEDARNLADIRRSAMETAQNTLNTFRTDPNGVDTAMKSAADAYMQKVNPRYINIVRDEYENARLSVRDNAMTAAYQEQKRLGSDAIQATLEVSASQAAQSAYQGNPMQSGLHMETYEKTLRDGVASGLMSQERANLLLDEARGQVESEYLMGSLYATYQKRGYEGALEEINKFKSDPNVKWDMAKRERFEGRAMSDLNQWQTRKNAEGAALVHEWESDMSKRAAVGIADMPAMASMRDALLAAGKPDKAREVAAAMQTQATKQAWYLQNPMKTQEELAKVRQRVNVPNNPIAQKAAAAAEAAGIDPQFFVTLLDIESGFDPNAKTGSYSGLAQLSPSERAKYGAGGDVDSQISAGIKSLQDRIAAFKSETNRDPEPWELYLAHQQGAAGAAALRANPDMRAVDVLARFKDGDPLEKVRGNIPSDVKGFDPKTITAGEFAEIWRKKYETKSQKAGVSPVVLKNLETFAEEQAATMARDPMKWVVQNPIGGNIPAVDFLSPSQAVQALNVRQNLADGAAQQMGVAKFPALTNAEIDSLKAQYEEAPVPGKLNILTSLTHGLRQDVSGQVLQKLAKDKPELAWSALISPANRQAAEGIVRGSEMLKAGPGFGPSGTTIDASIARLANGAYRSVDGETYQSMQRSVKALYAAKQSMDGKVFQDKGLDSKVLEQAYNEVTGGNVKWNGKALPGARYGQTQSAFEESIRTLPESAFAGAIISGPNGAPIPFTKANFLKGVELFPMGAGKYGVQINGLPVKMQAKPGEQEPVFVLNLAQRGVQ